MTDNMIRLEILNTARIGQLLKAAKARPFAAGEYGYQTVRVGSTVFKGQRDCAARAKLLLPFLHDLNIVDLGCNVGGMLHALANTVRSGVGVDSNAKAVNAATAIAEANGNDHLSFYTFDLDRDPLDMLSWLVGPGHSVDAYLVLAIAKWVSRWREIVEWCACSAPKIVFETNGRDQAGQIRFVERMYSVEVLSERSDDDPGQRNRKLLYGVRR